LNHPANWREDQGHDEDRPFYEYLCTVHVR
jgi:hypothetical protein